MPGNSPYAVTRIIGWALAFLFLLMTLTAVIFAPAAQPGMKEPIVSGYKAPIGERLFYSVEWDPPWYLFFFPNMHAGDLELTIAGKTEYKEREALKIVFKAYSSGILSKLSGMEIDDEFIFLSDPDTLCTLNVSKKVREGKRKRQIDVEYLPDSRQLHIREYDESVNPPKLRKDHLKDGIPPCVRDPFSALYSLRSQPLDKDSVIESVIGHDDVVKEVQSRVVALEALETTSGKISAWRIQTASLMGGLFKKGGEFQIWLSADNRQVPLQFEAKVPLGRVLGKLQETRNHGNQEPE